MALRRDAKIELLKSVPLFAGCSKNELRAACQDRGRDRPPAGDGTDARRPPGSGVLRADRRNGRGDEEGQEDRRPRPRRLAGRDRPHHGQPPHCHCHRDIAGRRARHHRPALSFGRRDDAVDRPQGARLRGRATEQRRPEAERLVARCYATHDSPSRARTSAKKSASGFTRYSGPSASVRSPSEVSSAR